MKSPYESYFGKNIARIVYLIACGLLIYGCFNVFVGNRYWGAIYCVIGVVPFFFTTHKQISNKTIDEKVYKTEKEYAEKHIKGKSVGRRELAHADFTSFSGYIWDDSGVRFKLCSDKKLRTSKFYVTAASASHKEIIISSSTYNLLNDEKSQEQYIVIEKGDAFSFQAKDTEFPKGNVECVITPEENTGKAEVCFFLPKGDYLAEQIIEKISKAASDNK